MLVVKLRIGKVLCLSVGDGQNLKSTLETYQAAAHDRLCSVLVLSFKKLTLIQNKILSATYSRDKIRAYPQTKIGYFSLIVDPSYDAK